jgi:hypothetical protein
MHFLPQELVFSPKYSPDYSKTAFEVTGRVNAVCDNSIVSATTTCEHDIRQTQVVVCFVTFHIAFEFPEG